jgi:crotonobetainyl-CoA hydratase
MTQSSAAGALVERRGNVMVITINRPEARNAVDSSVSIAVGTALQEADADADVRAVVLTGAGDKSFCAGADLKALSRGEQLHAPGHEDWGFAGFVRQYIDKPTIAAVNGAALGGGTELALSADLIVASETASFGLPEVARGLIAGAGGVFRLSAQIPQRRAMEMIFTGDPISAHQALDWGLVNRVVPQDVVVEAAIELAARISRNAPLSVQASKRIAYGVVEGVRPDEQCKWDLTGAEWQVLMQSDDAKEGPRAFAEKRSPEWTGR